MKILCNNCKHLFEVDPEKAGRIQYSKCASVFRVELVLKSPCPSCKTNLKVITNDKKENIGYTLEPTVVKKPENSQIEKKTVAKKVEQVSQPKSPVQQPVKKAIEAKVVTKPEALKKPVEKKIEVKEVKKTVAPKAPTVAVKDEYEPVKEITLEDRVKLKLKHRLDSYHRYSVQGFQNKIPSKKPSKTKSKFFIPNVSKLAKHASQPKVYLSVLTILSIGLVFGIMHSVFQPDDAMKIASQQPAMEEGLEEFEPTHHSEAMGGPSFPSENDRKTGLEDETIKKINSNLQILHLPPLRQVTSTYGVRLDPFTKKLAFHAGVDFKADMGTKIEAAMDGVVKYVGPKSMYGNAVVIAHSNGYETLYGHLSRTLVKQGQKIKQKDVIALAGSTGRSTGPHLHFELIKNGKKIDPLSAELLPSIKK